MVRDVIFHCDAHYALFIHFLPVRLSIILRRGPADALGSGLRAAVHSEHLARNEATLVRAEQRNQCGHLSR